MQRDTLGFLMGVGLGRDVGEFRLGRSKRYLINQPDMLRDLWQDARLERIPSTRKVLGSVAGRGLLSQEGGTHRRQRRLMQPAFHRERLAGYLRVMVEHTHAALGRWRGQDRLDLRAEMKRVALDIVMRSLFSRERQEDVYAIADALEGLLPKLDGELLVQGLLPEFVPVLFLGEDRDRLRSIRDGLGRIVAARRREEDSARRRETDGAQGRDSGDTQDLLAMLLETRDEDGSALSDADIAAQALTLIAAGFETSANTLAWLWWQMAKHPAEFAALREEVLAVLGERDPTVEDLSRLHRADRIVKETQRLYPTAWLSGRVATTDVSLGGRRFAKGSVFFASPYVTHRDERYFAQPLEFRPDRFAGEGEFPKFAYLPFGAGVHQCIGNVFALWEMKVVLALVARRVRLEPPPGFEPRERVAITLGMEEFHATPRWLD